MRKPRSTHFAIACTAITVSAVAVSASALAALAGPATNGATLAGRTAGQVGSFLALDSLTVSTPSTSSTSAPPAEAGVAPPVPGGVTVALASLPAPVVPTAVSFPLPTTTPPTTTPAEAPPTPAGGAPTAVWARLRQCESGGNYATDTGNGYYGAYQFSEATWLGIGETGFPNQAPPAIQDAAAQRLQARSGWGQWPACSRQLGLLP
jgi:hypothetical protein